MLMRIRCDLKHWFDRYNLANFAKTQNDLPKYGTTNVSQNAEFYRTETVRSATVFRRFTLLVSNSNVKPYSDYFGCIACLGLLPDFTTGTHRVRKIIQATPTRGDTTAEFRTRAWRSPPSRRSP